VCDELPFKTGRADVAALMEWAAIRPSAGSQSESSAYLCGALATST